MTPEERERFLGEPRTAVLSTLRRDGGIHSVPIWFRWVGDVLRMLTDRGSAKHRNLQRDNRATLCIDERGGSFAFLTAEGTVEVEDTVTREERLELHIHYRGREAAERVVDQGGHERLVLLLLISCITQIHTPTPVVANSGYTCVHAHMDFFY